MTYQSQLTPWVIYQQSEAADRSVVQRFRRRNDADAYTKMLKGTRPGFSFVVGFDVTGADGQPVVQEPLTTVA
jgi:hypothetical protein